MKTYDSLQLDKSISQEQLRYFILVHGRYYIEHRQVSSRLKELLHQKRLSVCQKISPLKRTSRVDRKSYTHPEFIQHIDHLININYLSNCSKVAYECGHMLLQARQSIESYQKKIK